jgi:hypothetical protein
VASPDYLNGRDMQRRPQDLHNHSLVAFALWASHNTWSFSRIGDEQKESIDFDPHLSINDYSEMASLLVSGAGIGELPPVAQPELLRIGRLIEIMPQWRFQPVDISIVHLRRARQRSETEKERSLLRSSLLPAGMLPRPGPSGLAPPGAKSQPVYKKLNRLEENSWRSAIPDSNGETAKERKANVRKSLAISAAGKFSFGYRLDKPGTDLFRHGTPVFAQQLLQRRIFRRNNESI